jgi:hypothetical protein
MTEEDTKSSSRHLFQNRGKTSKKDMQMNIKAMLAKTKIASAVTTSTSVAGPAVKHFQQPKK